MGETENRRFQPSFNSALKVDFEGSRLTSDAGLVLVRELDERLGFGELIARHLADEATKKEPQSGLPMFERAFPVETVSNRLG